jgi:hypothetical protein
MNLIPTTPVGIDTRRRGLDVWPEWHRLVPFHCRLALYRKRRRAGGSPLG